VRSILVIGGSSSRNSINKKFAVYAASQLAETSKVILDLNDFEMPIFSVDREKESGIPEAAYRFKQKIIEADGIIISLAEHNGSYSAAFKNIYDWVSRIEGKMWEDKLVLLLATSPGARGGRFVLEAAKIRLPFQGAQVLGSFSLPYFNENFSEQHGITDLDLKVGLHEQLELFKAGLI